MRAPVGTAVIVAIGFLAAALSACGDSATGGSARYDATVETPVAKAREAGITPYWFGESFVKDSQEMRWPGDHTTFGSLRNELQSIGFDYSEVVEGGFAGTLFVRSFSPDESLDNRREIARGLGEVTEEQVEIEGWTGNVIWHISNRGVLRPFVFVHNEDAAVMITTAIAPEGMSGPLGDLDWLLAIIDEHLQPFPE